MGKQRILIIDDDELILGYVRDVLEHEGFDVVTAINGLEACHHIYRKPRPDLVITDVTLNLGSGEQIVSVLRNSEKTKSIPVVYFSGKGERELKKLASDTGVDGYITKPAFPTEITYLVNKILHH